MSIYIAHRRRNTSNALNLAKWWIFKEFILSRRHEPSSAVKKIVQIFPIVFFLRVC